MTTPLLNQLIEEAVQACHTLATEAQDATTAAAQVATEAVELAGVVEQQGYDLHDEMTQAIAAVHDAAHRITAAADGAIAALESIPGRTRESATGMGAFLEALRREALRLDAARAQLFDGLEAAVATLNEDYRDLAEGTEEYLARVAKAFQEAGMGVRDLPDHTNDVGIVLGHRLAEVREEVARLGTTAEEHAAELVRAVEQGSQTIANHVVAVLNGAIGGHNELASELSYGVADPTWVEEAMAPLAAELGYMAPLADQVEEGVFPPVSSTTTVAERAVEHLETTSASLAKVQDR
jgi:hypothetical protein